MSKLPTTFNQAEYARDLGTKIYRARIQANLTQEQVAFEAGISTYTYQKLESGQSNPHTPANPKLLTLISLSAALKVNLYDIIPTYPRNK